MSEWIWKLFGPRVPRIELVKLRDVNFYPPPPDLAKLRRICIGTKTRTIGDALMLSPLPALLKARYPALKIDTYPRAFNPIVFYGNPHVDGVSYMPGNLYGDDCCSGSGHLIQVKQRFFDLPISEHPKPEIHLLPRERCEVSVRFPICVIHPWGKTALTVLKTDFWARKVSEWKDRISFWQVGIEGHEKIPGCEQHFLLPPAFIEARRLFTIIRRADFFMGMDSGPMHIARAFDIPSLIFSSWKPGPAEIFKLRREFPYYLHSNSMHGFLYEENTHVDMLRDHVGKISEVFDRFLYQLDADE